MNRRILSLLLAALLAVGLLPVGAFAAEGDAAPTAALPDGTSLTVTDTGMTDVDGISQVYKTTVPKETASIMVNWDGLDTAKAYSCCTCYDDGNYEHTGVGPLTVPLAGHSNDETTAVEDKYISSEVLAKVKSNSQDKMVILLMHNGANTKGAVLCIEVGSGESGETTDPDNTPPTLCEGVNATGDRKTAYEGIPFTLDLSTIFTDADGDDLTYTVSIDGGEAESTDAVFTRTFEKWATLKFSSNDGKVDSDKTYTVTVNYYQKAVQLKESGSGEAAAGESVHIYMSDAFKDPSGTGRTFYVSIGGGEKERIGSGQTNTVKFSRAFATPGVYTLAFYVGHGPEFVGPYTYTLTVTGTDIENHAPTVKSAPEGPGKLGTGCGVTVWKPDLASIFQDPDGDALTYSYRRDNGDFKEYYSSVGIHADYLTPDGSHTVTIRATDPYGEYAEFTVTIEKTTNHIPTKRADAPDAVSVFVPVGLTYKVDANLYYADADEKDQGNLGFRTNRYSPAGSYTAANAGDTKTETAYGYDGTDRSSDGISITYTAIAVDKEESLEAGAAYTLNVADLGLAGNVKVRVNAGAEQAVEGDTFTYTGDGNVILHFYSDKTTTAADNYVVRITWPKAPPTVTIGDTAYKVVLMGKENNEDVYKVVVPENFEKLTISGYATGYVDTCCKDGAADDYMPYVVSNHTCKHNYTSQFIDAAHEYICIFFYYDDVNEEGAKIIIQLGEGSETPFTPGIGNGYADGTTENGVTTFLAGIGSAAPTVTVTAPADGWTAGGNTFTVACEKACVVMVKSGETYTKLVAADSGDTHSFTATLADGDQIIVRLKGDVNGDGVINNTDAIQARAAALGKTTIDEANAICARVTGGSTVVNTDVIQIGAVSLGKTTFQW